MTDARREVVERLYVVTAIHRDSASVGYRTRLVLAQSKDEAMGIGLRLMQEREPTGEFCQASVISVSDAVAELSAPTSEEGGAV